MFRVVIDTNVVISAVLRSAGLPHAVLSLALATRIKLFVSEPILAEYEEVLRRPRLSIDPTKIGIAMSGIRTAAPLVAPTERVTVAVDPDDNIFLECAQAGASDFLVTGNKKDFPDKWALTRIVTPRQFIDRWAAASD